MGTLIVLLALTGPLQALACKPQFAPLETGTSSGTSTIDFWRKEEAGDWGGAGWLGWSWDGDQLRAVELIVRDRANDFAGDDAYVTVQSQPDVTFAVRCIPQRWHPYRLLLSSSASKGQLVGDAALFETGD